MSNKEVVSLEGVVKSDLSVEQRVYFVQGFQKRSQASIKAVRGLHRRSQGKLYGVLCSRGGLLGKESHFG